MDIDEDNMLSYTFDDLFASNAIGEVENTSDFNVEAWKAKKTENRQKAFDMVDQAAIKAVSSPFEYHVFLDVWSRLGSRFSVNNLLLIYFQRPDATELNKYAEWRLRGTPVMKGEPETLIITASPREDGKGVYYDAKKVFDIKQTKRVADADVLAPETAHEHDGRTLLKSLIDSSPVKVFGNDSLLDSDETARFDESNNRILVRLGTKDPHVMFRHLVQEISFAHLSMSSVKDDTDLVFLSHSASYLLSAVYGVSTPGGCYSFHDVRQSFGDLTPLSIKAGFSRLKDVYDTMRNNIDTRLGVHYDRLPK